MPSTYRYFPVAMLSAAVTVGSFMAACGDRDASEESPEARQTAAVQQPVAAGAPDPAYLEEVETWHRDRDQRLRSPDGWLSLVALLWIEEGETPFGSDPAGLVLPGEGVPARAGVFRRSANEVNVEAEPGAGLLHDGEPVTSLALTSDAAGEPTVLTLGSLAFFLIERGERIGLRVRDREAQSLRAFTGIERFPVDPEWRLAARFEPADPPRKIQVPNILGDPTEESSPGDVVLAVGGETYRIQAMGEPGEDLFLVFGDDTNGHETYGGGRFLYTDAPAADGTVVVDFNIAYNPPCVFTPYATCPLPPRQNKLALRIEAGEKMYGAAH